MALGNLGYFAGGMSRTFDPVSSYEQGLTIALQRKAIQDEMMRRRAQAAAFQSFMGAQRPMGGSMGLPAQMPSGGPLPLQQLAAPAPGASPMAMPQGAPQVPLGASPATAVPASPQVPQQQAGGMMPQAGLSSPQFDPEQIVRDAVKKVMEADPSLPPHAALEAVHQRLQTLSTVEKPIRDLLNYQIALIKAQGGLDIANIRAGASMYGADRSAESRIQAADISAQSREQVAQTGAQSREAVAQTQAGSREKVAGIRSDTARAQIESREKIANVQQAGAMERLKAKVAAAPGVSPMQKQAIKMTLDKLKAERAVIADKVNVLTRLMKPVPKDLLDQLEEADKKIASYLSDVAERTKVGPDDSEQLYEQAQKAADEGKDPAALSKRMIEMGLDPARLKWPAAK